MKIRILDISSLYFFQEIFLFFIFIYLKIGILCIILPCFPFLQIKSVPVQLVGPFPYSIQFQFFRFFLPINEFYDKLHYTSCELNNCYIECWNVGKVKKYIIFNLKNNNNRVGNDDDELLDGEK